MGYEVDACEQAAASLAGEGVVGAGDQDSFDAVLSPADFAWAVGSLAKAHHITIDEALVLQQFVAPYTVAQVHEALDALGLNVMSVAAPALEDGQGLSAVRLLMSWLLKLWAPIDGRPLLPSFQSMILSSKDCSHPSGFFVKSVRPRP